MTRCSTVTSLQTLKSALRQAKAVLQCLAVMCHFCNLVLAVQFECYPITVEEINSIDVV